MTRRLPLLLALCLAGALAPGGAGADEPRLVATVGPGATISLRHPDGSRVTRLDPGTYELVVTDLSAEHNFRLTGPGVSRATGVEAVETVTWTVTLAAGTHTFLCDPHASFMRGTFAVGAPPPAPRPPARLAATVGPGRTIGVKPATVRAGPAIVTVRDRSAAHNFHLTGPGLNRRTAVKARGTVTWRVTLRKGATYRFVCDPHRRTMKGSFRAT